MALEDFSLHRDRNGEEKLLKWDEHVQAWHASIMPQSLNAKEKRLLKHQGLRKVPINKNG
jgi:hypothetical protein